MIVERLRVAGFGRVFFDVDRDDGIAVGTLWEEELYRRLRSASALVFVASPDAIDSRWCAIEIAFARESQIPIFPVAVRDTPIWGLVADRQWLALEADGSGVEQLIGALEHAGIGRSSGWDDSRSPYPGLPAFERADEAVFFGRDDETAQIVDLLSPIADLGTPGVVAVIGPSGSGKSSIVRAGVLATLARATPRWSLLDPIVPAPDPMAALEQAFGRKARGLSSPRTAADIHSALTRGVDGALELANDLCSRESADRLLVTVDQLEAVRRLAPAAQEQFLALLKCLSSGPTSVRVLATLGSEFLGTGRDATPFTEVIGRTVVIEPLGSARLPEVVERPAHVAGVTVDPGLTHRIVAETQGGDALPLLAYTLREMYDRRRHANRVTITDYEGVGGVIGALSTRADRTLGELASRFGDDRVLRVLLTLVSVEGDDEPSPRSVSLDQLAGDERAIVDAFVEARLLTTAGTEQGVTTQVAHAALLRQWAPLANALSRSREEITVRTVLNREADAWLRTGRDPAFLLRGTRLAALGDIDPSRMSALGASVAEFLVASREQATQDLRVARRAARRFKVLSAALAIVACLLTLAVIAAVNDERAARSATKLADSRALAADAIQSSDLADASLLALEAYRQGPTSQAQQAIRTVGDTYALGTPVSLGAGSVPDIAFSPDGQVLAAITPSNSVVFLGAASHREFGSQIGPGRGPIEALAFNRSGTLLAIGFNSGLIQLWSTETRSQVGASMRTNGEVVQLKFNPAGRLLASAAQSGTIELWRVDTQKIFGHVLGPANLGTAWTVAFSPDGRLLAASGEADNGFSSSRRTDIYLWHLPSERPANPPLVGNQMEVADLTFSPNGKLIGSGGWDDTVRLWSTTTHREVGAPLRGNANYVSKVAFSPNGDLIASVGLDLTLRVWNVRDHREVIGPLEGAGSDLMSMSFSPTGQEIATGSADGLVQFWALRHDTSGSELPPRRGSIDDLAFAPTGGAIAASTWGGKTWLWDIKTRQAVRASAPYYGTEYGVAYDQQGTRLIVASAGGFAVLSAVTLKQLGAFEHYRSPGSRYFASPPAEGLGLATHANEFVVPGGARNSVQVWGVDPVSPLGRPYVAGSSPSDVITATAASPNARYIAAATYGNGGFLWPAGRRREPIHLEDAAGIYALAFSPDGNLLATADAGGRVILWSADTGRKMGAPMTGVSGALSSVTFSPNGDLVAAGGNDNAVHVWSVESRQEIGPALTGPSDGIGGVAFAPDGTTIAAGDGLGQVFTWRIYGDGYYIRRLCDLIPARSAAESWSRLRTGVQFEPPCA